MTPTRVNVVYSALQADLIKLSRESAASALKLAYFFLQQINFLNDTHTNGSDILIIARTIPLISK